MKVVEEADATASLAECAAEIASGPVIETSKGQPVAALLPIENADLETVCLSTNPQFLDLVERSGASVQAEGATPLPISSAYATIKGALPAGGQTRWYQPYQKIGWLRMTF